MGVGPAPCDTPAAAVRRFKKRVLIEQLENFLEEIHSRANNINHVDSL